MKKNQLSFFKDHFYFLDILQNFDVLQRVSIYNNEVGDVALFKGS